MEQITEPGLVVPCRKCRGRVELSISVLTNAENHECPECHAIHYLRTKPTKPVVEAAIKSARDLARVLA